MLGRGARRHGKGVNFLQLVPQRAVDFPLAGDGSLVLKRRTDYSNVKMGLLSVSKSVVSAFIDDHHMRWLELGDEFFSDNVLYRAIFF